MYTTILYTNSYSFLHNRITCIVVRVPSRYILYTISSSDRPSRRERSQWRSDVTPELTGLSPSCAQDADHILQMICHATVNTCTVHVNSS